MSEAPGSGRRAFVLWRRGGGLWGIAHEAVKGMARHGPVLDSDRLAPIWDSDRLAPIGGEFELAVGEAVLPADEIVAVTEALQVRPPGAALRRYWPEAACGLAVHQGSPLVLIDPAAPPRALVAAGAESGEPSHDRT
ncbi:MAG TPA: hypothetical protein VHR45_10310 [Thermoanaerobaculia bacterium]|nr:hypothetical protein [Thermoanaerobaculia bacterium]